MDLTLLPQSPGGRAACSLDMRSLEVVRVHVRLLVEHIGHLAPHQVHDAPLGGFQREERSNLELDASPRVIGLPHHGAAFRPAAILHWAL